MRLADLSGKRFGMLTVSDDYKVFNKTTKWLCVCDCGNKKYIAATSLKRGLTRSCGCLSKAKAHERRKNVIGMRVGRLVVKKELNDDTVECLCDCGKTITTKRSNIIDKCVQSCGCLKIDSNRKNHNYQDLTGKTYGDLTVIKRIENPTGDAPRWQCICSCGNITYRNTSAILKGSSCGCKRIYHKTITHGLSKMRLYHTYSHMIDRCHNPKAKSYKNYGGRGIVVCDEWKKDFTKFYEWSMANGYSETLTIDRIDNEKGYSPENCRWVNSVIQSNNRRNNRYVTYNGITKTVSDWSRESGIKAGTIISRLNKGWSIEDALFKEKIR